MQYASQQYRRIVAKIVDWRLHDRARVIRSAVASVLMLSQIL